MNENFQGIRFKLLFGTIINAVVSTIYIIIFWHFLKDPAPIIGPYATDPQFLSFWAIVFPGFIIFCVISFAISLICVVILLNRFETARQAMRNSNRWKDMLLARSKDQILTGNFGLLAAPAKTTTDASAVPLKDSERVVIIMKVEAFDLSALLSQAFPSRQLNNKAAQISVKMPFFMSELIWENVQVLCDPNGKTPRLIRNAQGEMWGVLQTRSALASRMMTVFIK